MKVLLFLVLDKYLYILVVVLYSLVSLCLLLLVLTHYRQYSDFPYF